MPIVTFKSPLQDSSVTVAEGTTILDAAEECGAQVGHSCGGECACSTCHVWVRRGFDSLPAADDMELDRLDQGFDVRPISRLACQAKVQGADLEVWITDESLQAYMDENPQVRAALAAQGKWPVK